MTDRKAALERVAEAARELKVLWRTRVGATTRNDIFNAECRLGEAVAALDATPDDDEMEKMPWKNGHNHLCWYCGEPCDSFTGNPGLWPLALPLDPSRPGHSVAVHNKCVLGRLRGLP